MAAKEEVKDEKLTTLDSYRLLGRSGLKVSPLCLGTMTFGKSWDVGTDFETSKKVFDLYRSSGGNLIDTANAYTNGESEKFVGDLISSCRSEIVVGTKYSANPKFSLKLRDPKTPGFSINMGGNSRLSMVQNLDESLKRMGIGHIDLFYIHNYDFLTPINEVMRGLDDCVRSGKATYIAISDHPAWIISRANTIAELRGWSPFIALQTRYNLIERSLEGELGPMALEMGLGIIPWGTLAEGFLTGKHKKDEKMDTSGRNESVQNHFKNPQNEKILAEVTRIAKEINKTPSQVALNWTLQRPMASPLVGAKTVEQLKENLDALNFKLTPEQMKALNEVSKPSLPFPQQWGFDRTSNFNSGGMKVAPKLPFNEF